MQCRPACADRKQVMCPRVCQFGCMALDVTSGTDYPEFGGTDAHRADQPSARSR